MVAKSPYSNTSDYMYQFWLDFKKICPSAKLGGMYANKAGYHNRADKLPSTDYSKRYAKDKLGPKNKASAIDLTLSLADMKKYSGRLLRSGKDKNDPRGNYLREFFGNVDGNSYVDGWDFQAVSPSSSDKSHLWHIHISIMRAYIDDPRAYDALLSILKGETVAAWRKRTGRAPVPAPKPKPVYHYVKPGQTLIGIAKSYKISYATLQKLNPQKKGNWNNLYINEKIRVK